MTILLELQKKVYKLHQILIMPKEITTAIPQEEETIKPPLRLNPLNPNEVQESETDWDFAPNEEIG